MKNLLLLLLSVFVFTSCLDDDDETKPSVILYGVVQSPYSSGDLGYGVKLDRGQFVVPTVDESDEAYEAVDNDRVVMSLEYNSLDDYYYQDSVAVKVLGYLVIKTYDAVTYNEYDGPDTLGNDPLAVGTNDILVNENYMTVYYSYLQGDAPTDHTVNLVYYPDSAGENGEAFLKLQHNADGDLEEETYSSFKVFNLNSIEDFAEVTDSLNYIIKVNSDGFSSGYADYFTGTYYKPE